MADQQVKVLLIDDDEDDAVLIRDWLAEIETASFVVDWVQTYQDALEAIGSTRHDVYLVDYRLGEHTGLEVLQRVMECEGKAPVIMLTGAGNRRVDEEAMQAGAADYLVKSHLNVDLLERSIRYALKHKQVETALQKARDELELRVQERTVELTTANESLRAEIAERKRTEQKLRDSERLADYRCETGPRDRQPPQRHGDDRADPRTASRQTDSPRGRPADLSGAGSGAGNFPPAFSCPRVAHTRSASLS